MTQKKNPNTKIEKMTWDINQHFLSREEHKRPVTLCVVLGIMRKIQVTAIRFMEISRTFSKIHNFSIWNITNYQEIYIKIALRCQLVSVRINAMKIII